MIFYSFFFMKIKNYNNKVAIISICILMFKRKVSVEIIFFNLFSMETFFGFFLINIFINIYFAMMQDVPWNKKRQKIEKEKSVNDGRV